MNKIIIGMILLFALVLSGCSYGGNYQGNVDFNIDIEEVVEDSNVCVLEDVSNEINVELESFDGFYYDVYLEEYICDNVQKDINFGIISDFDGAPEEFLIKLIKEITYDTLDYELQTISAEDSNTYLVVTLKNSLYILWYDAENVYVILVDKSLMDSYEDDIGELLNSKLKIYSSDLVDDEDYFENLLAGKLCTINTVNIVSDNNFYLDGITYNMGSTVYDCDDADKLVEFVTMTNFDQSSKDFLQQYVNDRLIANPGIVFNPGVDLKFLTLESPVWTDIYWHDGFDMYVFNFKTPNKDLYADELDYLLDKLLEEHPSELTAVVTELKSIEI